MIVQIYEIQTPEEAAMLERLGVDHIGVLVGDGAFPRELSTDRASAIFAAEVPSSSWPSSSMATCAISGISRPAASRTASTASRLAPAVAHRPIGPCANTATESVAWMGWERNREDERGFDKCRAKPQG